MDVINWCNVQGVQCVMYGCHVGLQCIGCSVGESVYCMGAMCDV